MTTKNKKIENQWVAQVKRLLPVINILHLEDSSKNVRYFCKLVSHLLANKGDRRAIEMLKAYRLAAVQFVLKQTVTNIPFCKTDRDGFPKAIRFLKPDRSSRLSVMYTMSVLRLIEEFRCKPDYSVDTITAESSAKIDILNDISDYIRSKPWVFKLLPKSLGEPRLVLSNKAGPNGPASITCLKDLQALRSDEDKTLYTVLRDYIKDAIPKVDMDKYQDSDQGGLIHSKLVFLQDKACKTRVVAIADWWSNVALSSLHDAFMKGLRRIPNDVTYFQDRIPDLVKDLGPNLYSSDMTAFTDRFPAILEEAVVSAAYGEQVGRMWRIVTTHRSFYNRNVGEVQYAVGNPMGLLSSWAVSTFTHHVIKAWCAHKCGLRNERNYRYLILGDDTLDTDSNVYKMYIKTINDLGVSISTSKCTVSENGYAEFAKRLFTPEGEVTGLPVHLLNGLRSNPEQVLELVRICRSRGYEDSVLGPSLEVLLSKGFISDPKMVADILSLPEILSGAPPLLEGNVCTRSGEPVNNDESYLLAILAIARNHLFWKLTQKLSVSGHPKDISAVEIDNNHPLVFALNERIDCYLPEEAFSDDTWEEDEYWIYDRWMEGKYMHLCNIPSVDTYKFYNKGHKATKCRFDVTKLVLKLMNGDCNIPLTFRTKHSNQELYDIALESITPKRDHSKAVVTSFTK